MRPGVTFAYIFGLHLRLTLLVLGFVALVVFLGQFADIARYMGSRHNIGLSDLLVLSLLRMPSLFQYVMPHILAVSAVLAVRRIGTRFELAVLVMSGRSAQRLLAPVFISGLLVGLVFTFALSPLASMAAAEATELATDRLGIRRESPSRQVVLSEAHGTTYAFAERVSEDGARIRGLTLFEMDDRHRLQRRVTIEMAELTGAGWVFHGQQVDPPQDVLTPRPMFDTALLTARLPHRAATSLYDLPAAIALAGRTAAQPLGYAFQLHWLIALPALLGAISYLAGTAVFQPLIAPGWGRTALALLLVVFPLYIMITLMEAFAVRGLIPPLVAAWLSPVLALVVAQIVLRVKAV